MKTISYRPDIDGLRAIAVLSVVFFHLGADALGGGYVGVDVFFVVSGYLITLTCLARTDSGSFAVLSFFDRRARRLAGAFVAVVFATWMASFALMMPEDYSSLTESVRSSALFLSNHYFYDEIGYFDKGHDTKPLLHLWSLAIEEQFYLGIAILFGCFGVSSRSTGIAIRILLIISLLAALIWTPIDADAAFFLLPFRAWELATGVVVALYLHNRPNSSLSNRYELGATGALAVLLGSIMLYDERVPFPGAAAVPPVLAAAAIIITGACGNTFVRRFLSWRPLVTVGRRSYGIYLIHWPLIVLATYYLDRDLNSWEAGFLLFFTLILAEFSWRCIEMPLYVVNISFSRHAILISAVFVLVVLFLISSLSLSRIPLVSFLNPKAAQLARGGNDWTDTQRTCPDRSVEDIENDNFCVVSRTGRMKILLWGDSHATAILPAVEKASEKFEADVHVLTRNGCPPLLGLDTKKPDCRAANSTVATLVREFRYDVIILAANWQSYATSNEILLGGEHLNAQSPALPDALRDTIDVGRRNNSEVIVVGQVPVYGVDVPSYLGKAEYLRSLDSLLGYERTLPTPRLDPAFLVAATEGEEVRFIRPFDYLCSAARCEVIRNGISLYRDGGHLSRFGAAVLERPLEQEMRAALATNLPL